MTNTLKELAREREVNQHLTEAIMKVLKPGEFAHIRRHNLDRYDIHSYYNKHAREISDETKSLSCIDAICTMINALGKEAVKLRQNSRRISWEDICDRPSGYGLVHRHIVTGSSIDPAKGMTADNYYSTKQLAQKMLNKVEEVARNTEWLGRARYRNSLTIAPGPSATIERWSTSGSSSDVHLKVRPLAAHRLTDDNLDETDLALEFRRFAKKHKEWKWWMPLGIFDQMDVDYENLEQVHLYRVAIIHRRLRRIDWKWMAVKKFRENYLFGLDDDMEAAMKQLRKRIAKAMLDAVEEANEASAA